MASECCMVWFTKVEWIICSRNWHLKLFAFGQTPYIDLRCSFFFCFGLIRGRITVIVWDFRGFFKSPSASISQLLRISSSKAFSFCSSVSTVGARFRYVHRPWPDYQREDILDRRGLASLLLIRHPWHIDKVSSTSLLRIRAQIPLQVCQRADIPIIYVYNQQFRPWIIILEKLCNQGLNVSSWDEHRVFFRPYWLAIFSKPAFSSG